MAEFPALPLWTDAWLGDTGHLKRAERGLYMDLLVLIWRSPGCRIPNEIAWIARKLNVGPDEMPILESLIKEFLRTTGNWLWQKRLTKEFKYVRKTSRKQSDNAKSGWEKRKKNASAHAKPKPKGPSGKAPTPTPTPTPTPLAKPPLDWADLERMLRQAAGWENEPHPNLAIVGQIAALIESGADLDRDVLPIVKAKAPEVRKRTSWNYFTGPIQEARDRRVALNGHKPPAQTPLWENWTERDYENAVFVAKRNGEWHPNYGPSDRIPAHLLDDELRGILQRSK